MIISKEVFDLAVKLPNYYDISFIPADQFNGVNIISPTQSDLQKYLREFEDIHISIYPQWIGSDEYVFMYRLMYVPLKFRNAKRRSQHSRESGWNIHYEFDDSVHQEYFSNGHRDKVKVR